MKFLDFEFIPLMLLPSLVLLYLVLTNKSVIERIFDPQVLKRLKIERGLSKQFRIVLLFSALFMMILALARPVHQKGIVEVQSYKGDLVIALDISRSMKAKDYYPDRLAFAKKKIEELIDEAKKYRIGIIAFAKDAFIVSPITDDRDSLKFLLDRLDTKLLSLKGTNIMAALMSARLLYGDKKPKNILLVTDGGEKSDFSEEIAYAKEHGFKVSILGVATPKGAPIEEGGEFVKDAKGNLVITRLNPNIKALAQATGGIFVQASYSKEDIQAILNAFGGIKKEDITQKIVDQVELYPIFLALALLFLFMSFYSIPSKAPLVLLPLLILPLHAGLSDFKMIEEAKQAYERGAYDIAAEKFRLVAQEKKSPQSYYDAANAYYKAKKYKEAIKYYNMVQTSDKELEFRKLHNLGNSYFKLGQYEKAIRMYQKALTLKNDPDTKHNLELAKKMLEKKRKKEQKQQKNQKKKEKKDKQKSQNRQQKQQQKQQKKEQKQGKKEQGQRGQSRPKNEPISDREEKKWLKRIERNNARTLLYKAPVKIKKEAGNENPW